MSICSAPTASGRHFKNGALFVAPIAIVIQFESICVYFGAELYDYNHDIDYNYQRTHKRESRDGIGNWKTGNGGNGNRVSVRKTRRPVPEVRARSRDPSLF